MSHQLHHFRKAYLGVSRHKNFPYLGKSRCCRNTWVDGTSLDFFVSGFCLPGLWRGKYFQFLVAVNVRFLLYLSLQFGKFPIMQLIFHCDFRAHTTSEVSVNETKKSNFSSFLLCSLEFLFYV